MTMRPHLNDERPLDAPVQVFDLTQIAKETWSEASGTTGHNAITLHKGAHLRVVLMTMRANSQLEDHTTSAPITLQVLSGHVRFVTLDTGVMLDLGPQMMATLQGGISHRVEAVDDAVCLLTLGDPVTRG